MISDTAALARAFFALVPSPIPSTWLSPPRAETNYLQQEMPVPDGSRQRTITCRDWMNLSRFGKMNLVGNVWGVSRFGMTQTQIVAAIDAYCLQQAIQAQNRPRSSAPGQARTRPAGEITSPQGAQWGGVAFIAAMFGFFYWGLRAESPEEKLAYDRMKAARRNPGEFGQWTGQPFTKNGLEWREEEDWVLVDQRPEYFGEDRGSHAFPFASWSDQDILSMFNKEGSAYSVRRKSDRRIEILKNGTPLFALVRRDRVASRPIGGWPAARAPRHNPTKPAFTAYRRGTHYIVLGTRTGKIFGTLTTQEFTRLRKEGGVAYGGLWIDQPAAHRVQHTGLHPRPLSYFEDKL